MVLKGQCCQETEGLRTKSGRSAKWSSDPACNKVKSQAYRSCSASLHQNQNYSSYGSQERCSIRGLVMSREKGPAQQE